MIRKLAQGVTVSRDVAIWGLVIVAAILAWGTLLYLSYKAWVWSIVELAKWWEYL